MKTSLLSISACLLLVCSLAASDTGVRVIAASEDLLESRPRRIVTSVFFVSNQANEDLELKPEVALPPGWHLIASDRALHLEPGQKEMSLVSFLIPRTAQAGSYEVGFSVRSDGRIQHRDSSGIRVDIMPITKVRLEILEYPNYVVAGETYDVSAVVMNQGNTAADIEISAASHTSFPMTSGMAPLSLPPGGSAAFRISVRTDPGIRRVAQERLSITARSIREPIAKDQAWCYLEILPRVSGMRSRFNKVPATASISYFNEQNGWDRSKAQAAFRGSGNLDDNGNQYVDFAFRGPDLGQNRLLGNRDEYFLKYRYGSQSVIVGDYSYSVSPLTEGHRYGRGCKALAVARNVRFGGYHMRARWSEPDVEQTAGHVDYHFGDDSMAGIRYLKRAGDKAGELMSFESRLHPVEDTDLEVEYARALADRGENDAYRLKLMTQTSWGSYLLRFIRAGADYTGYYRNMDFISTSLGLDFTRDFRFNASFRQERHNLNLDPAGYSAPLERDYRVRLLFRSGTSMDYSLAYRFRESRDQFAEPLFDFRERSVRAALSQRYARWDSHVAAEIGRSRDLLSSHTKGLERYTATLRIRPSRRQSYHGYFYYDSNGGPGTHTRRHLSAGITASIVLRHSTTFDVGVRSNVFEDIEDQDRDVIELSLRQKLFRQTELVFRGHYTDYRAEGKSRHLAFMVEYNIPFGMPVSRRDEVGTLRGEVYDQETGLPIKDVILKLADATAVTDKAGRFSFPTSPVGTHHLTVDRASIGLGRITRRRFPMEISVEGGKTASIEIAVVRGATVTGRIDVYAYEDSTSGILTPDSRRRLEKTGGLANTLIELTDGEETKRLLTAGDGSFSVHELRPGRWTFVIPPEHLPEHCSVENPDMHFTLQPGEAHTVSIRIIPRERPIRILEDGGTLIEEARQ